MRALLLPTALLVACRSAGDGDTSTSSGRSGTSCPCEAIALPSEPVTEHEGVVALLAAARAAALPELGGVSIGAQPFEGVAYFRAWTELDTVGIDDGAARDYTVHYDPVVLADPMPPAALAALLVHELGHIADYVAMDSQELVAFALWYGTEDPDTSDGLADYERQTDEVALDRGCAEGLAAAREWIYAHASPEILDQKRRNYYTPEEIAAWAEAHGACPLTGSR